MAARIICTETLLFCGDERYSQRDLAAYNRHHVLEHLKNAELAKLRAYSAGILTEAQFTGWNTPVQAASARFQALTVDEILAQE